MRSRHWKMLLLCAAMLPALAGCWSYRGLDQVNIVVGVAVDYDKENETFQLTYEVADLSGEGKTGGPKGKLITSEGKTIFEAVRNAKTKEGDRLFFASTSVLILSHQVVEERGLLSVIEWFLRDGECRETMCVALSLEENAKVILQHPEGSEGIMSSTLHDILKEDKKVTASTVQTALYESYSDLKSKRRCTVLAAVRRVEDGGEEETTGVHGAAVVKEEGVVGYLTPEQCMYYLMAKGKLGGGIIPLAMGGGQQEDLSLEIYQNEAKVSFTNEGGTPVFHIRTKTWVAVGENQKSLDMMDLQQVKQVEATAQRKVEEGVQSLLDAAQQACKADLLGFGEMVYQQKPALWAELEPDWDKDFPDVEVTVKAEVLVDNSSYTK